MSFLLDSCTAQVRSFEFSDFIKKCAWYMLFCFFWSGQYIIAAGEIVFAMAGKFVRGLEATIRYPFMYGTALTHCTLLFLQLLNGTLHETNPKLEA